MYYRIQSINHRHSLDRCYVYKQRDTNKYGISKQDYDFTITIYTIQGIKQWATNAITIGWILVWWKYPCNGNGFYQLHILFTSERKKVAVDQIGKRNIHIYTSVGIWQSTPQFYLFRFLALGNEEKWDVTLLDHAALILETEWRCGSNGCSREAATVALVTFLNGKVVFTLTGCRQVARIASTYILCVSYISSDFYYWFSVI